MASGFTHSAKASRHNRGDSQTYNVRIPAIRAPEIDISASQLRAITEATKAVERLNTPEMRKVLEHVARVVDAVPRELTPEQVAVVQRTLAAFQESLDQIQDLDEQSLEEGLARVEGAAREEEAWRKIEAELRNHLDGELGHVGRHEIEELGVAAGLSKQETVELFEDRKDVSWRGDYILTDEGWIAAWIEDLH